MKLVDRLYLLALVVVATAILLFGYALLFPQVATINTGEDHPVLTSPSA